MTFEQLRIFVAVAERQHMTRAADALHLTQSAVSNAVHALESGFGMQFFDRIGRGIELTEAGRILLQEASEVLARVDSAKLRLSDLGTLRSGTLRVYASQTIASYWLPRYLVQFRHAYPAIRLSLIVGNTSDVVRAVREGLAELGFTEGTVGAVDLVEQEIARDQLVVVVSPDHPWCLLDEVAPAELARAEWVLREAGSGTRSEFEAALAGLGIDAATLNVTLELPTNEAVRAAVEAGGTATAISASVAAPGIEAGLLREVPFRLPQRTFRVVTHAERGPSRSARALMEMVTKRTARRSVPDA